MKKLIAVLFIIGIMFSLSSCSDDDTVVVEDEKLPPPYSELFTPIRTYKDVDGTRIYIIYAKDTGVMYYLISGLYRSDLCPIYDSDGVIQIYQ